MKHYLKPINYIYRYAKLCITNYFLLWLFTGLMLISCREEEKIFPDPEISLITAPGYIAHDTILSLGDTGWVGIEASSRSDVSLTHLNVTFTLDEETFRIDSGIYLNDLMYHKQIVKGVSETEQWSFYVQDRDGRKSQVISLSLFKDTLSQYGEIATHEFVLGAQENLNEKHRFAALQTGLAYVQEEAFVHQELINLLYYYDNLETDENTISSPGANIDASFFPGEDGLEYWSIKNTTRFLLEEQLTSADFEACANDSLILYHTFEFSTGKRKAKNLRQDDIYAFVTESGIRGLMKVKEIAGQEAGEIMIIIKMQAL